MLAKRKFGFWKKLSCVTLVMALALTLFAPLGYAVVIPFPAGPSLASGMGGGVGEVAPRGFGVELPSASGTTLQWLSSEYDNKGMAPIPAASRSGVSVLPTKNFNGENYTFYAYVQRNPNVAVLPFMAIYENGVLVSPDRYTVSPSERGNAVDPSGQASTWRIPINGLELLPGATYEFAFLRGITANNSVTGVISEDGTGYLQSPTGDELTWYEAHKSDEYQYREYQQIYDAANNSYTTLIPNPNYVEGTQTYQSMRYSFTTAIDPQGFYDALSAAQQAQAGLDPSDVAAGRISVDDIEALNAVVTKYEAFVEDDILGMTPDELATAIEEMSTPTQAVAGLEGPGYNDEIPTEYVLQAIQEAGSSGNTVVNISSPDTVPAEVFGQLYEIGGSIEFRVVGTDGSLRYSWGFSGADIDPDLIQDVNLTITMQDASGFSVSALAPNFENSLRVLFEHQGPLPAPATVLLGVGTKYADGQQLMLYKEQGEGLGFELLSQDMVVSGGKVRTHILEGATYMLVPLDEVASAESTQTPTSAGAGTPSAKGPATGDYALPFPILLGAVALVVGASAARRKIAQR